jgi:hypothetical protein
VKLFHLEFAHLKFGFRRCKRNVLPIVKQRHCRIDAELDSSSQ